MKKVLATILCVLTILAVSGAAVFAARHHDTASMQPTTIAEIKANGWDDQRVVLDGKFTKHVYKDIYVFTDNKGEEINVDVDDDDWYQVEMNTPVRIYAEVDKDWHGDIELEVKRIN